MHTHEPSHLATPSTLPRTLRVATTDGLSLAVYVHGDHAHGAHGAHDKPCVLLVHGYPDTSEVYDGMVAALSPRYRVVTYDSRGAGASDKPQLKAAYLLPQLLADMHAVIDAVSPKRPVHLVGHDWGSIQSWHAVTDPSLQRRVASFTSISGPSLDYAGAWMRKRARGVLHDPRGFARLLAQLARSSYIAAFVTPGLGEWVWHSGLADRLVGKHGPTGTLEDKLRGLNLYRANMLAKGKRPQPTTVPVQVLAPNGDAYVGHALQAEAPHGLTPALYVRQLVGGHWMPRSQPAPIARAISQLIDHVEGAAASPDLAAARVQGPRDAKRPLVGQLVVVTGGGGGIGRATALDFAKHGANVVVGDIDLQAADATATQARALGVTASAYPLDVADRASFAAFAARVLAEHGTAAIVVNNAGIGIAGPFMSTSAADWQRILDINLGGVIEGSRLFAQQMIDAGRVGQLVNIASAAAYTSSRTFPAYATTKAAVLMLSECLRGELAPRGIGVTAICPGFINTNITRATTYVGVDDVGQAQLRDRAARDYGRRNYTPERVAQQIVRAALRNEPLRPVTPEAHVLLAIRRYAPWLMRRISRVELTKL